MESVLNAVFFVGIAIWLGGVAILVSRANQVGDEYLSQLPPVNGVPLHMYRRYYGRASVSMEPIRRAWRQPQSDPELERLRHEGWRRFGHTLAWGFGFPIFLAGVMTLLTNYGLPK